MAKQRQTLMDFMVIGISPTLIMGMVGSLLFFLLTVFYHGGYSGRMNFICAMFTMAIVLIARISMEEGIEYASMFGIPLAIVTMFAMGRFVEFNGPLADLSTVINGGLIALIWWSAHKLTWDCTFIDDTQDASGEGLLQGMGFDSETVEQQASAGQPGVDGAAATAAANGQQPAAATDQGAGGSDWYQRMVARRKRRHTPGVWVMYYALAALPLFGIGHWLIPASDAASRWHAFRLICVYVASALGLLSTTSFLGLRRYLRQRNLQMPIDMASLWLGAGAVMIGTLMLVCLVLPRPGASLSISQLPFGIGSPEQHRTSRYAMGDEGPEKPEAATRTNPQAKEQPSPSSSTSDQQSSARSQNESAKQSSSQGAEKQEQPTSTDNAQSSSPDNGQQKNGQSSAQQDQSSQRRDAQSPSRNGNDKSPADGKSPSDNQQQSEQSKPSSQSQQQSGQSDAPKQDPQQSGRSPSDEKQPSGKSPDGQQPRDSQQPGDREAQQAQNRSQDAGKTPQQQPEGGRDFKGDQRKTATDRQPEKTDQEKSSRPSSSNTSRPQTKWNPTKLLTTITSGLGNLLKLVFFAALACVAVYFAWKHRAQLGQALAQLWRDLQSLWARMWGRRPRADENAAAAAAVPDGPQLPAFASYRNPFARGKADRYSMADLVRYSFEALEAWGREHDCARQEDQTPFEFAQQVARRHAALGPETQVLADLYCRLAYGRESIEAHQRDHLRRLWQQMV